MNEYAALSKDVTARIYQLSSNVNMLKRMAQTLGTSSDTRTLRNQMLDNERESKKLSNDVMDKLRRLSELQKSGDPATQRSNEIATNKLSRDFQAVLLKVEATNKDVHERTKHSKPRVPDTFEGGDDDDDEETGLLHLGENAQRQVQAEEVADNERLIREREEGIKHIEKSVVEVNEIFKDLNSLVVAQGEMVDSIEANIVTAADRVETGTEDLLSARRSQKKSQKKMIFIAVVAVIVLIVLILIIYFTTKK